MARSAALAQFQSQGPDASCLDRPLVVCESVSALPDEPDYASRDRQRGYCQYADSAL